MSPPPALIALLTREQLPEGKPQVLLHTPDHLVVIRLGDEVFALDQRCSHAGASLVTGVVRGRTIECRAHGCRFDLTTGALTGTSEGLPLRQRAWLVERRGDAWAVLDGLVSADPGAYPLRQPPGAEEGSDVRGGGDHE